jgi:hypothetical protein
MVEYGQAVGQGSGAGGSGAGGGSIDVGAGIANFVSDAIGRISALPPEALLLLIAAAILVGLLVLRRAF